MAKMISEEQGDKYEPQGYIHQSSHKWQAEHLDIDRQAQERFEKLIEGMKQAQGKRNA